jgi:hypothetical protein
MSGFLGKETTFLLKSYARFNKQRSVRWKVHFFVLSKII